MADQHSIAWYLRTLNAIRRKLGIPEKRYLTDYEWRRLMDGWWNTPIKSEPPAATTGEPVEPPSRYVSERYNGPAEYRPDEVLPKFTHSSSVDDGITLPQGRRFFVIEKDDHMQDISQYLNWLGLPVKDRVRLFVGVVVSVNFDSNGCVQAAVAPPIDKDGKMPDAQWFDVQRLEKTGERVMPIPTFRMQETQAGPQGRSEMPPSLNSERPRHRE